MVSIALAIMSFLGLFAVLSRELNSSKDEYKQLNAQLEARCNSISGEYANGSCYKSGIKINWSKYDEGE